MGVQRPTSVLVVQSDAPLALFLQARLLDLAGREPDVVPTLAEAIARLHRSPVDAVVIDLDATGLTAREATGWVRFGQAGVHVVVIGTALTTAEILPGVSLLNKPVTIERLWRGIEERRGETR